MAKIKGLTERRRNILSKLANGAKIRMSGGVMLNGDTVKLFESGGIGRAVTRLRMDDLDALVNANLVYPVPTESHRATDYLISDEGRAAIKAGEESK